MFTNNKSAPGKPKMISVSENMRRSIAAKSSISESSRSLADNVALNQESMESGAALRQNVPTVGATDIEEFLHYTASHPLREQRLTNYALLVKNEDFHLYSVEQDGQPLILKVMCDPDLFYNELEVYTRLMGFENKLDSKDESATTFNSFSLQLK